MDSAASPSAWAGVRQVVAMRGDNIGDVVMLGPALRALHRALPGVEIDLLCSPGGAQAVPLLPWVRRAVVHRALWQDVASPPPLPDPARELELVGRLRAGAYDAAVVFTSFAQSPYPPAYAAYLAGVPLRLGQSKEWAGGVLTHWLPAGPDDVHQVDRSLALLEHAGLPLAGRELELAIPPAAAAAAEGALAAGGVEPGEPFVALAPGASASARIYPPERYGAAARELAGDLDLPVVLVGGPRERELAARVQAGLAGTVRTASLVGETSVPELAAVIARARLLLANNSSPPHLADALGTPTVLLFAGTELERQWRPRSTPTRLLRRPTACSPCYRFACPYALECLDVPPGEVAAAGRALLAGSAPAAAAASASGRMGTR